MDLIFDTETTGFFRPKAPPNDPIQPDLVQLAAILADGETILSQFSILVLPEKKIDPGAEAVHGKSLELLKVCGVSRATAVQIFNRLAKKADHLVAHNISFDLGVMATAYVRAGEDYTGISRTPEICTMKDSTDAVGLPGKWGKHKWPKLEEAYLFFMGENHERKAHDALEDTLMCHKILCKMRQRNIIN